MAVSVYFKGSFINFEKYFLERVIQSSVLLDRIKRYIAIYRYCQYQLKNIAWKIIHYSVLILRKLYMYNIHENEILRVKYVNLKSLEWGNNWRIFKIIVSIALSTKKHYPYYNNNVMTYTYITNQLTGIIDLRNI